MKMQLQPENPILWSGPIPRIHMHLNKNIACPSVNEYCDFFKYIQVMI
jgi:hypothetical protein